jgi:AcrR family transcriptional regulator
MAPADKRAAIEAAAERLFAAQGFAATSVADIAGAADVAVGSVYRFFPDKPALLAAVHRRVEARFIEAMRRGWSSTPRFADRFAPMVAALFDEADASREVTAILAMVRDFAGGDAAPGAAFVDVIAGMYAQGQAAGAYRGGDPAAVAAIAYGMVEGAMRHAMTHCTAAARRAAEAELVAAMNAAFLRR